ncbi:MAG: carboxylesterase family protein [Clostridia bacterium]|nr:carboxylesterase family protein [Clostridia bacterium]
MNKIINTPCGKIQGTDCRLPGVVAFKGIRYATAGRWEYPKLVTGWDGVYDATAYGNCSYQPRSFYNEEENLKKVFYYNEFRKGAAYTYSEDCLFLNVWTPETATEESKLPVLVYIHGGGYTGGCGHEKHFDDPVWPTKGVVAVTVNYRLGPLGFCCLPELAEEAGHCGNYGLYDQLTSLQWVRDNISAFGGDPDRVTIMGQSAGAMSVQQLCTSPLSDGLFRGAVMSSGCGMGSMLMSTPEKAYAFWQAVMQHLGCSSLAELRNVAPEELFAGWQATKKAVKGGLLSTCPVKDGYFVVEGTPAKQIPYIIGSNSHDMVPPILFSLGRRWGIKNSDQSYVYMLDRMLPGDKNGSWHSADLWYWFGTLENGWRPFEQKDYDLSDQMSTYLCNFVKNGNPNGDGQLEWTACNKSKKVLLMGERPTRMGKPNMLKLTGIMLTNKSVGE